MASPWALAFFEESTSQVAPAPSPEHGGLVAQKPPVEDFALCPEVPLFAPTLWFTSRSFRGATPCTTLPSLLSASLFFLLENL